MTILSAEDEAAMREAIRTGKVRMFTSIEIEMERQWCREHGEDFSVSEMHRRVWAIEKEAGK